MGDVGDPARLFFVRDGLRVRASGSGAKLAGIPRPVFSRLNRAGVQRFGPYRQLDVSLL